VQIYYYSLPTVIVSVQFGCGFGGQVTGAAVVAHGGGVGGHVGELVVDVALLHSQLPLSSLLVSCPLPDAAASSSPAAATMSKTKAALLRMKGMANDLDW
jgi:hypothetical protein